MSCISKHISIQQAIMVVEFLQRSTGVRRKYKEGWFCCLIPRLHDTTGCQTSCQTGVTTGLTTVLNEQLFVQPVIKPGCTTGLTTGLHDTAGCQTVECLYTRYSRLSNRLDNRFDNRIDNRLCRVYKHLPGHRQQVVSYKRGL